MKILFDQGTPVPLRDHLSGHAVMTAYEQGRSDLANGDLLRTAENAGFECLVTADQKLRNQQNLSERKIGIVVLLSANWPRMQGKADTIAARIATVRSGEYVEKSI